MARTRIHQTVEDSKGWDKIDKRIAEGLGQTRQWGMSKTSIDQTIEKTKDQEKLDNG